MFLLKKRIKINQGKGPKLLFVNFDASE